MNERLKQLVKQSGLDDDMFPIDGWNNPELAKFAALIIKECSQMVFNSHPDDLPFVGGKMLVHFGIQDEQTSS